MYTFPSKFIVRDFPVHVEDRRIYDLQLIKLAHDVFSLRQTQDLKVEWAVCQKALQCTVLSDHILRDPAPHRGLPVPAHYHFYLPTIPKPESGPQENGENRFFGSVKSSPGRSVSRPILISINPDQVGFGPPGLWLLCNLSHEQCPRARGQGPHIIIGYRVLLPPPD